ncbi:uncharacterized protein LOC125236002 [Leguminivora glycinivorella]|uniref:uncharacterized protein LOC125236002 n=1 Tax=Leguminivora glycinivorella TaxID=1035111 RepID=UPI00200EDDF4|nr:uncharacterized protein LOC125236002 [Leguminivora glycinivorella]
METIFLLLLACCASAKMSVMYTHDRLSDMVVESCLAEMFPKPKKVEFQVSDEGCIIFCVLKKFGIMTTNGLFNLDVYKKRVETAHQLVQLNNIADVGSRCIKLAKESPHSQDVCRTAKIFNDCTHLYRIML